MKARELAQALLNTEADDSDGPLVQVLVLGQEPTWAWVKRVEDATFHDGEGASRVAVILCEPVNPEKPLIMTPVPKTTEEKIAFRKDWDARVEKGKGS